MALSPVEDRYLNTLTAVQFPDQPVEPETPAEKPVMLAMGGSGAGVGRVDRPISDVGTALLDTGAGVVRGAVAQTLGIGGDLQMLFNGLKSVFNRPEDQGRLEAFYRGMQQGTLLPTTEDMGKMLPPVVPAGAADAKSRQHNANIGQTFGEFAPLPGLVDAGVAGVKAGVKATKGMPAGLSIKDVSPAASKATGLVFPKQDVDTRLRLKQQRNAALEKGKALPGEPKNERTAIAAPEGSGLPDFAVGKITFDDWKDRVESMLTPEQIDEYSRWYSEIRDTFLKYTNGDEEKADRYMSAWLVANQNTSVDSAMANALRQAEQFARGIPESEMVGGGLPTATEAARRALKNEPITSGVGAKIADFVDSASGSETRSFFGNQAEGGAPFVVDIHTARDTGLVDPTLLNHLERLGYKVDRNAVKVDFQMGPTDTQYENRADFGRSLTQHLNDIAWQGRNDWQPHEVQAIGWMAMTRLTADAADNTVTALERNFRRISMEVAPGEGSPWAQKFGERFTALPVERQYEVTQAVTSRAVEMATNITGVDLRGLVHGTGGWENFQNPAAVAQALATREGAEYTANVLGYLLQQTEVWVNSVKGMTKNPKAIAIDFIEDGSENLSTNEGLRNFWENVMQADPTGLFKGYQPIRTVDGQVGIRVLIDQGGAKRMSDIQLAIEQPLTDMVRGLGFRVRVRGYEADLVKARNDWKESPDGRAYLGRLADFGRGRAPADLDSLRQELEKLFERELAGNSAGRAEQARTGSAAASGKAGQVTGGRSASAMGAE